MAIVCAGYNASRDVVTLVKSVLFHRYGFCSALVHTATFKAYKEVSLGLFLTPVVKTEGGVMLLTVDRLNFFCQVSKI